MVIVRLTVSSLVSSPQALLFFHVSFAFGMKNKTKVFTRQRLCPETCSSFSAALEGRRQSLLLLSLRLHLGRGPAPSRSLGGTVHGVRPPGCPLCFVAVIAVVQPGFPCGIGKTRGTFPQFECRDRNDQSHSGS